MAETQPTFIDDLCYPAGDLRLMQAGLVCSEGVAGFDSLRVTQTTPASGDVEVSAGHGFITNDNGGGDGGVYHVYNDDVVTLTVPLNSTGSDRTDVVWAQVCDSEYAAVTSGWTLIYDDNNPTATPPADGCTYYLLATLIVPNGGGSGGTNITGEPENFGETDSMITDERGAWGSCGGGTHYAQVLNTGSLGAASGTYDLVVFDQIAHMDADYFSYASSEITVLTPGLYEVNAQSGFTSIGTSGTARSFVVLMNNTNVPNASPNGTRIAENRTGPQANFHATPTRSVVSAAAGTTFKLAAFQDTGSTVNYLIGGHLTVRKIG